MSLENFSNLKENLQKSWVDVVFTKKDGSAREMTCTTNMELIPEQFHPKKKEEVTTPEDEAFEVEKKVDINPVFNVYEKDKGWRSFRWKQLTKINDVEVIHNDGLE